MFIWQQQNLSHFIVKSMKLSSLRICKVFIEKLCRATCEIQFSTEQVKNQWIARACEQNSKWCTIPRVESRLKIEKLKRREWRNLEGGFKDFISLFIDSLTTIRNRCCFLFVFYKNWITVSDDLLTKFCTSTSCDVWRFGSTSQIARSMTFTNWFPFLVMLHDSNT